MKIVVMGGSGMLGAMVLGCLAGDGEHELIGTVRTATARTSIEQRLSTVALQWLDATEATLDDLTALLDGVDWVVNAIGIIKPYIHDDNAFEVERAIQVNGLFPHRLARAAERTGTRVLQIATDCVYSGTHGDYLESDEHDARDVYGKTKSLGEVHSPAVHHLRCSIVGPELNGHASLLEWFVTQPKNATVKGFVNHRWNGVTTLHFGRLCRGIMESPTLLPHVLHIVPGDIVSKAALLGHLADAYRRRDITIEPVDATTAVDRTLQTTDPHLNAAVWLSAGYDAPPTVAAMIAEMAAAQREWPPVVLNTRFPAASLGGSSSPSRSKVIDRT